MNTLKEWRKMKKFTFVLLLAALAFVGITNADTLRLRSGQTIEGTFLGADTRQIKFLVPDGQPKTYALTDVETITFASTTAPPAPAPPPKPTAVTVLAGTIVLVRMVDSLATSKTKTGQIFTAILESSLVANSVIVAHKGTTVHSNANLGAYKPT
jgi:hypothetical protein